MSSLCQMLTQTAARSWHVSTIVDPDLWGLALFCALGLVTSLYVIVRFPDAAALVAQCYQF